MGHEQGREEEQSWVPALQLPEEENGPLVGAGIVGHAPEPERLRIS